MKTQQIIISRDVVFHEEEFPFHFINNVEDRNDFFSKLSIPRSSVSMHDDCEENRTQTDHQDNHDDYTEVETVRRSSRISKIPSYLKAYYCNMLHYDEQKFISSSSFLKKNSKATFPISYYISYEETSLYHRNFIFNVSAHVEPESFQQTEKEYVWRKAMNDELEALKQNNTWTIVKLPPEKNCVGCRWTYKIKYNSDGFISKYKARLVAKGYTQKEGIDFYETFSPIAKMVTVKMLIALAASKNWFLNQLDVNNAFLQGDLNKEIYMYLPQGLKIEGEHDTERKDLVCRLPKSIYGLKQASRQWHSKLSQSLFEYGFVQSKSDYSLFTKGNDADFVALLVYVDDIIVTGLCKSVINETKSYLHTQFNIKDLGDLKYFLGIEIVRSKQGIVLSQRHYTLQLLEKIGYLGCKPVRTPMNPRIQLNSVDGEILHDVSQYRRLVGKLVYLMLTRPNITFAVHKLSQFLANPRTAHLSAVYHLLRYLKSTTGQGLFYSIDSNIHLKAFSDADWGAC